MRCPSCDYALWNLVPGPCPECGRAFRSDEFEFEPGTVAFLCTACGQQYFGTDAKGLLVPREFACTTCGAACSCGQMAVAPTDRIDPLAERSPLPWLDRAPRADGRGPRGVFKRFFITVWWFTARGWKAVDGVSRTAPLAAAWRFAAIAAVLSALMQVALMGIFPILAIISAPIGAGAGGFDARIVLWIVGIVLTCVVAAAAVSLAWTGLLGVCAHGILRVSGPTRSGCGATVQAMLYPVGVQLWGSIPICCFGSMGGYLWWMVLCCGTVKRVQQVSWTRACAAVVIPALPGSVVLAILLFVAGTGLFSSPTVLPAPRGMPVVTELEAPAGETSSRSDDSADSTESPSSMDGGSDSASAGEAEALEDPSASAPDRATP